LTFSILKSNAYLSAFATVLLLGVSMVSGRCGELVDASGGLGGSAAVSAGVPAMPPVFSKGPLVLFGASTTALRKDTKTYGELLEESFKKWQWPVQIVNAGVPGNSTSMARKRFKRDVLDRNPSVVVIHLGINDAAVDVWKNPPASEPRVPISDYRMNLEYFVDEIRNHGAEVVLMTPQPLRWTPKLLKMYGKPPYVPGDVAGLNVLLEEYVKTLREVAREKKVPLVDVYAAFADGAGGLLQDGMHPNDKGHALIYRLLLDQWILNPVNQFKHDDSHDLHGLAVP
jgi:lysophospholipase L1-like esterase